MSTMDYVLNFGIGINLGNTFEACGDWIAQWGDGTVTSYETAWGSPVVTEKMIKGYADAGFGVVRIPVAWSNMMDNNYNIDQRYLDRVKEVTSWVVENGMCAIVNIHWDGGWWEEFPTNEKELMKKYTRIWEQICGNFGDFGHEVMFESLNEEGCWNDVWNRWGGTSGKQEAYELLGRINQKFVDVVRSSGKNNTDRHLLIAGYATDVDLTCDSMFVMPNDPAGRYAVSIHYYTPSTFAILSEDASWGKAQATWGTSAEVSELKNNMDKLYDRFISKGIPVIMGEFGCATSNKEVSQVRNYMSSVCKEAYIRGVCPVVWDTPGGFYDRNTAKFTDTELLKQIMDVKKLDRKK